MRTLHTIKQKKTNVANIIVAIARAATEANCKRSKSVPVIPVTTPAIFHKINNSQIKTSTTTAEIDVPILCKHHPTAQFIPSKNIPILMALAPCWYATNKNPRVPTNSKRMRKQLAEYLPARTAAPPQACQPRCVANEIVEPSGTKACNQRGAMFRPRRANSFKQNCHAISAKKSQRRKTHVH